MTDPFASSDSARSANPLRHARTFVVEGRWTLRGGGELPEVTVCYETWGTLSPEADNAVLVCHAVTGDSHAARHDADDDPGWWDLMVGPGAAIDTERYFVVCANVLGGCRGTTGPNFVNPATGRRWGADFPTVTVEDMVDVHARLLDHLGIERLLAVVGGSLGGFQALALAVLHPERTAGCVGLATASRLSSQGMAFNVVGRNAITHDPNFHAGQYYDADAPDTGLALARMLAHITYLSSQSMQEKFDASRYQPREVASAFEKKFAVGSYLAHQGSKFVERFDANSYVTLSLAMDLFDLGADHEALCTSLAPATCSFALVSYSSDWLYPPEQSRDVVRALVAERKSVNYLDVTSSCGHDAFLLADDLDRYGAMVGGFLAELAGRRGGQRTAGRPRSTPTDIFHGHRLDYDRVLELVPPGASVLELGCGGGELLGLLRERGHDHRLGVELDERAVVACIADGHDALNLDLTSALDMFDDRHFDVAIMSQTLQSVPDTVGTLGQLVRVAERAIVSFPNFAHRTLREMLWNEGRLPRAAGGYGYEWYETPNRRFPSIRDFEELCARLGIAIERHVYLDSTAGCEVREDQDANYFADIAVVVIRRGAPA